MKIHVTTCNSYRHLVKNFAILFNKFWPGQEVVVIGNKPVKELPKNFTFESVGDEQLGWSEQMTEYFKKIDDDYILLLHEDFYFMKEVDTEAVQEVWDYAERTNALRAGLQGPEEGYTGSVTPEGKYFVLDPHHEYLSSLEASIWNRKRFLDILRPNETVWDVEIHGSKRAAGSRVIISDKKLLSYKDAIIHGDKRIKFKKGQFFLMTPDGWQPQDIWLSEANQ